MHRGSAPSPTCLITGVAGNIGSKLAKVLLETGCNVLGIDNFFSSNHGNLDQIKAYSRFKFQERTVVDSTLLYDLTSSCGTIDILFHLAAIINVPWSMNHPQETMLVNYTATKRLHEQAKTLGIKSFVFAGSAAEYGKPTTKAVSEDEAGHTTSPYGESKFLSSLSIANSGYGCALRFFNLYGPSIGEIGPYDSVVRSFISQIVRGKPITIYGDGCQVRDFVYIFDAIDALLKAAGLTGEAPASGIFNIGTGVPTTIKKIAELLLHFSQKDIPIQYGPERAGDIFHSQAAVDKMRNVFGFVPKTPVQEGLASTYRWYADAAICDARQSPKTL